MGRCLKSLFSSPGKVLQELAELTEGKAPSCAQVSDPGTPSFTPDFSKPHVGLNNLQGHSVGFVGISDKAPGIYKRIE